jgi:hypothetical protein
MILAMTDDLKIPSDDAQTSSNAESASDEGSERRRRRGPPPNPLYHPLFLPILLVVYSLWFGYDGFLNSDPEYEHRTFNQVMFGITAVICVWVVPRGIREYRQDRARAASRQDEGNSS